VCVCVCVCVCACERDREIGRRGVNNRGPLVAKGGAVCWLQQSIVA